MTKEYLAEKLHCREMGNEISADEEYQARVSGLVAVFGASDDLMKLRGAVCGEVDACDGGECYIKDGALLRSLDDETELEVLQKHVVLEIVQAAHRTAAKIEAKWDTGDYSWVITATVPFATFDILEDGDKFCRGIVIDVNRWLKRDSSEIQ